MRGLEFETAGQLAGGMKNNAEAACRRVKSAGQPRPMRRWFRFDNSILRWNFSVTSKSIGQTAFFRGH